MFRHKKHGLFSVLGLLFMLFLDNANAQHPIEIAIFNESTSVPFSGLALKPLHPGIQIGTDIPWKESQYHKTYLSINVRYIFHKHLYKAIAINLALGYDYKMDYGANLKTGVGIGYMHTFGVREEYRFKNGNYDKRSDTGNSRFTPSLSFGLGYRFNPNDFGSPEIFAKQQYWLELPYSPGFIPLMSHANTMMGAKFYTF